MGRDRRWDAVHVSRLSIRCRAVALDADLQSVPVWLGLSGQPGKRAAARGRNEARRD